MTRDASLAKLASERRAWNPPFDLAQADEDAHSTLREIAVNLSQFATAAFVSTVAWLCSACSTAAHVWPSDAPDQDSSQRAATWSAAGVTDGERPSALAAPAMAPKPDIATRPSAAQPAAALDTPLASTGLAADESQMARYTTVSTVPGEADGNPLAVVAKVHFPREVVVSVGDAVRYLLIRTGYRLVPQDRMHPSIADVFALPLPDNQRVLGPYRVETLLSVLMGKPYTLRVDPAVRTVSYDAAQPTAATERSAPASAPATPSKAPALVGTSPPQAGSSARLTSDHATPTSSAI